MRDSILRIAVATALVAMFQMPGYAAIDLTKFTIVPSSSDAVVSKAAEMLSEELEERAGVSLPVSRTATGASILIGLADSVDGVNVPDKPESYAIAVDGETIKLVGRDSRGALFAAGRLIRLVDYGPGTLTLDLPSPIATAPDVPYRAHQLAYRNTANTYDAWSLDTYEQYIRDLIFFGCNGVELIPSLDKESKDGPVMTESMHAMNVKLSELIGSYGIDVWLWSPVMAEEGEDVTTPEGAKVALEKRRAIFADYPVIDHLFVPGGDDGDAPAEHLVPFLKDLTPLIKQSHPDVQIWISNQTFTIDENNYFFDYLESQNADWLTGVVYGPWTSMGLEEMRARTPEQFALRLYPDITHTVRCQYPVREWDPVFANTVGREPVMPMPKAHRHIYLKSKALSDGFGTYSDGNHDDFNKAIWSAYGWDPDTDIETLLEEYGKVWWGPSLASDVAKGLKMLEENWSGPILENRTIPQTLELWESISERCSEFDTNWRAQMYLFRARFDAYVQEKAKTEKAYQEDALATLAKARELGTAKAIADARAILDRADVPPAPKLREGIESLGPLLLKSIGYQLSVKPPYQARNPERGAMLDWLDQPVNDRPWLEQRFNAILAMPDSEAQLDAIDKIVHWTDPGPGGFYDNLGAIGEFKHVVYQRAWEDDPSGSNTARSDFPMYKADREAIAPDKAAIEEANAVFAKEAPRAASQPSRQELRMSWQSQISTHYGTPLKLHYDGLDPKATYRLRVTYAGRYRPSMTMTLNDEYAVHGPVKQPDPIWPVEYYIPAAATNNGTLEIEWNLVEGRGCMVSEVWLIRD